MKNHNCLVLLFFVLAVGCVAPKYNVDEQVYSQTVDLKLLRVFHAQEGDAGFRAYLVKWEG